MNDIVSFSEVRRGREAELLEVNCSITTLCGNKNHYRRSPLLCRLGTDNVRVRTVAELVT